jgi:hypothetical protein
MDVVYIAISLAFFLLMLAYVRACDALGRNRAEQPEDRS